MQRSTHRSGNVNQRRGLWQRWLLWLDRLKRKPRRRALSETNLRAPIRTFALTVTLACLAPSMTSCARAPTVVHDVQRVVVLPDQSFTQQEPIPPLQGDTNDDLINAWESTIAALKACNGRAAGLAKWMADPDTAGSPSSSMGGGADDHP